VIRVLSSREHEVRHEDDVVHTRHIARDLAQRHGFDAFATAAITTATSELSRNVLVHGRGGLVLFEEVELNGVIGLRLTFVDRGPGIHDIDRAMMGGFSTGRSLGLGLSGSRRLVDEFDLRTEPGSGTTVQVVKWARFRR
jgi:serine/threonine-protein kinase RsbT